MDQQKLFMELLNRIIDLEENFKELKKNVKELKKEDKFTRNDAIYSMMNIISEYNIDVEVKKGNRESNADILIYSNKNKKHLKVKFYFSKSHSATAPASWHRVCKEDVLNEEIDLYIFYLYEPNRLLHSWFFTHEQLKSYVKTKAVDKNKMYHFYFKVLHHYDPNYLGYFVNRNTAIRTNTKEDRDDIKEVDEFYNTFSIVSSLLGIEY